MTDRSTDGPRRHLMPPYGGEGRVTINRTHGRTEPLGDGAGGGLCIDVERTPVGVLRLGSATQRPRLARRRRRRSVHST